MIKVIQCVLADLETVLNRMKREGADLVGLYSANNVDFVAVVEGDYDGDDSLDDDPFSD